MTRSSEDQPTTVSVAEARARFSELLDAVESGETVVITRRGTPIADLQPHPGAARTRDLSWLREATQALAPSETDGAALVRDMRDADRY